ncbi:MAG: hypothetical protein U0325_31630 [Polyangiales bacterium]
MTTECTGVLRPATGCECAPDAPAVPCNLETGTTAPSSEGVCRLGQRSCREGRWSACEAYDARTRVLGSAVACSGSCDPSCRHFVDCIELGDPIVPVSSGSRSARWRPRSSARRAPGPAA